MIPPWKRPDNFSVTAHQRLVDFDNQTAIVSAPGQEIQGSPAGRGVIHRPTPLRPSIITVSIQATETGAGKYSGFEMKLADTDVDPDTDLIALEIANLPVSAEEILIINEEEQGAAGHMLPVGAVLSARWRPGKSTDDRRVAIVHSQAAFFDCDPGA